MSVSFEVHRFNEHSPYLLDAVNLYVATWGREFQASHRFISNYARLPGFRGRVAVYNGMVVGMGFGHQAFHGNWWYDRVVDEVGFVPQLQGAWILVELCVASDYRGKSIGSRLHNELLDSKLMRRAILSTEVRNMGARRLYERLGWRYLHDGMIFSDGQPPYVVMCKELH